MARARPRLASLALLAVTLTLEAACTTSPPSSGAPASPASSARQAAPPPTPSTPPCASAQPDQPALGLRSDLPIVVLASGLAGPDDLLVEGDHVLVGEHASGRIAVLGGPDGLTRLPETVPEVEGLARLGQDLYAADQRSDRVVVLRDGAVRTFFQLRPVPGVEGVDGIAAAGSQLVVPDSAGGSVHFVDASGAVVRRIDGFARPTGAWPLPDGSLLVADENAGQVVRVAPGGGRSVLASGLPLVDDVAADAAGAVYAISIGQGSLVRVEGGSGRPLLSGLQEPQGLGLDPAGNPVVSELGRGTVEAAVTSFKLLPAGAQPALAPGQPLCVRLVRAPGFADPVELEAGEGYRVLRSPGAGSDGEVLPDCAGGRCRVQVRLRSGERTDSLWIEYRRA
jgi:hypothetical protein